MYRIFLHGRLTFKGESFWTYDEARNFARKVIRKRKDYFPVVHGLKNKIMNPALSDYGYSIRVA